MFLELGAKGGYKKGGLTGIRLHSLGQFSLLDGQNEEGLLHKFLMIGVISQECAYKEAWTYFAGQESGTGT